MILGLFADFLLVQFDPDLQRHSVPTQSGNVKFDLSFFRVCVTIKKKEKAKILLSLSIILFPLVNFSFFHPLIHLLI